MAAIATLSDEVGILSRAVAPENGNWPSEIARAMLTIHLSPEDRQRMNDLADKARAGTLTCDEELEIETYRQTTRLIELMKAKSRVSLQQSSHTPS